MWKEGSILIGGKGYRYWVKQFDEGSQYGIDGGRISKLMIKRDGEIVCNYDRGWDIEPVDTNTRVALQILLYDYNSGGTQHGKENGILHDRDTRRGHGQRSELRM